MATKYCDHGAYGVYAAIPTWGAAQDGDGTAIGAGTPSTAEIVFTGIASTGVISVLGQAITFTRVTDANTCANNLATAINASTAVATGPASFTTLSQVRNHLYARGPTNGAPAGTCQIMTRQASASHAGLIAVTHTLNNVSSPATVNFAGGAGGCWGYIGNTDSIWPSAVTLTNYGIFCSAKAYTGTLEPGDVVKVRSGKTLVFLTGAGQVVLTLSAMGTAMSPIIFEIDDSAVWPDGPNPVLRLERYVSGNVGSFGLASNANTTFVHIKAKAYPTGVKNLSIVMTSNGISWLLSDFKGANLIEHVRFAVESTTGVIRVGPAGGHLPANPVVFKNCLFEHNGRSSLLAGSASSAQMRVYWIGCDFVAREPISATYFAEAALLANGADRKFIFDACRFTGFVAGSTFMPPGSVAPVPLMTAAFRNCDLGEVRLGPVYLASTNLAHGEGAKGIYASSQNGTRDFSYEDAGLLFTEWRYSAGRPTLNAKLHDGVTPWSIYAVSSTVTNQVHRLAPATLPRISKLLPAAIDLAEGARTFTLNFLLESSLAAWTKAEVSALFEYVGTDGVLRTLDTYDSEAGVLTTSTAAWSSTAWNGQTWLKRTFSAVTPVAVMGGSEVVIHFRIHSSVANDTLGVILDPEVVIA